MKLQKNKVWLIRTGVTTVILLLALHFEHIHSQRLALLLALFAGYTLTSWLRFKKEHSLGFKILLYLIESSFIILLEINSRFVVNYFFHSLYYLLIIEVVSNTELKMGSLVGSYIGLVAIWKYGYLIYYQPTQANIIEGIFILAINAAVLAFSILIRKYRDEKQEKEDLYYQLLSAYRQLERYSAEVEKLSVSKERNRMARELHDSMGHRLTGLLMQLQLIAHQIEHQDPLYKQIEEAIKQARLSLKDLQQVVQALPDTLQQSLTTALQGLIKDFSGATQLEITADFAPLIDRLPANVQLVLYRVIQEGLTNAVKHGKATHAWLRIWLQKNCLCIRIRDNGQGCSIVSEGHGLRGMRERLETLHGQLDYESRNGFKLDIEIPLGGMA